MSVRTSWREKAEERGRLKVKFTRHLFPVHSDFHGFFIVDFIVYSVMPHSPMWHSSSNFHETKNNQRPNNADVTKLHVKPSVRQRNVPWNHQNLHLLKISITRLTPAAGWPHKYVVCLIYFLLLMRIIIFIIIFFLSHLSHRCCIVSTQFLGGNMPHALERLVNYSKCQVSLVPVHANVLSP